MTVIAAKRTKNGFTIASDSISISGEWAFQTKGNNSTFSKLFNENGAIVGCTGAIEEAALFQLFLKQRKLLEASMGAVLELMSDFADWKYKKTDDRTIANAYLIGLKGKVFLVIRWQIVEIKTFYAIGAGNAIAMTAMHLGHSAKEAVRVAIELSLFCEGPVQVKKTREK